MTNVLKFTKKMFTVGVVATTIMWSLGVAALVPSVATAAECSVAAGDMIKVAGKPDIWIVNTDLTSRSYFMTGDVFKSWNADDSYSKYYDAVSSACMTSLKATGATLPRPGVMLVQEANADQLYVVLPGAKLQKITDAAAKALYGSKYKTPANKGGKLLVLDNATLVLLNSNFSTAAELTEAVPHEGMLVSNGGKFYVVGAGMSLQEITDTGLTANRYRMINAYALASTSGYSMGTAVAALDATLSDRVAGASQVNDNTTPVTGGDLMASLAADSPAGTNLADGTAFNTLLKFNLKAGDKAVTVNGLTLKKGGYVANSNISGIDVVDGSMVRHGNVVSSVNSDNEVVVLFGSSPVTVPANGMVTLSVRVNLGASAGGSTVKMGVAAVDSTATAVSGLTVWGSEFNTVDGSNGVASATFDVQPVNASGANVTPDDANAQEVTKFRVTESNSKEDLYLHKLTLFNYGNASASAYKDVELVATDGTVLTTVQPVGQYVTFDLASAPYKIPMGEYKDLTVRMKLVGGTSTTVQLVAYNDYDVVLKGAQTGYYVLPSAGSNDSSFPVGDAANYNASTITGGSLSFGKDSTSPSAAVTPGASNVVLAKYYIKALGEDMELRKVNFGVIENNSTLTGNVYVKVDGKNVYSAAATAFTADGTVLGSTALSTYPTLKAGVTSYLTVEGSVRSTATSGASYQVNNMQLTEVRKLISNTIVDPGVSATDGNSIAVNAGSLTATTLSIPVAATVVPGTNDFEVAEIELSAMGSGEDVRVANIVVSQGTSGTVTDFGNMKLYNGSTQLTTSNSTVTGAASTTFTFSTPLIVQKGTKVTLSLKGDVITRTDGNTHTFRLHSVSATGKDTGTTVSATPSGAGQAMTISASGTLTLTLLSGSNASPATTNTVAVGAEDGTYFAFKMLAANEALKLRSFKLTATSTSSNTIRANSVRNVELYLNDATTPFATANELTCSGAVCTYTWTATDNLLPSALQPGSSATIKVKADVGGQGEAKLGDNFVFMIASSTADVTAVGTSGNSATVSGTPTAAGYTYVTPFSVTVEGVTPASGSSNTQTLTAGSTLGRFKVTNNGSAQITLTDASFIDNGSNSTGTETYKLLYSSENSQDYSTYSATSSVVNSVAFGTLTNSITINGGSYRYLTVALDSTVTDLATGDSWNLAVGQLGKLLYTVTDANLGYDGDVAGDGTTGSNTGLYVVGTPSLGTLVKS